MPETTKDEVESGFMGLMVVLARTIATSPEIVTVALIRTSPTREMRCHGNMNRKEGAAHDTSHMSAATIKTTTAGGIFNSRKCNGSAFSMILNPAGGVSKNEKSAIC
jgi:hypothetical protein